MCFQDVCWQLGFQRTNAAEYSAANVQKCTSAQVLANHMSGVECTAYVRRVYGDDAVIDYSGGVTDINAMGMCLRDVVAATPTFFLYPDASRAASAHLCDQANFECFCPVTSNNLDLGDPGILYSPLEAHEDTRYYVTHRVIGPSAVGTVQNVAAYTDCCQLCANTQPPPAPPALPRSPDAPPLPPGTPPPPPRPVAPPNSVEISQASASVLGPDNQELGCRGIVFWTDSSGNEMCTLRSRADITTGSPRTDIGAYAGTYLFSYNNPPPPPNLPSSAVCNGFQFYNNAQIPRTHEVDATSNLIPGAEGTSILVADVDNPFEWETPYALEPSL